MHLCSKALSSCSIRGILDHDTMPSDLLTRVQQLTSGVVEIDGGRLKGSGYGPRDMIQCEVAGRFVPMTHSNFSRRGRLPVKVNVPGEMRPTRMFAHQVCWHQAPGVLAPGTRCVGSAAASRPDVVNRTHHDTSQYFGGYRRSITTAYIQSAGPPFLASALTTR